jgi:protein phosphatase 1 regulatory subunit 7
VKHFRIQDQAIIDEQILKDRLLDNDKVIIQFSKPVYTSATLAQIDKLVSENSYRLEVRFYNDGFDCASLDEIPNVKALSIDCVRSVKNIDNLKTLKYLNKIRLGIFELENLELLSFDNLKNVDELSIGDTKSKALNLDYLKDYTNLRKLQIVGHTKNISVLSSLTQLKTLQLNSVSKVPISFVNDLKILETLSILLGSRANINEIDENNIENLTIDWVRRFNDLSVIKKFKNLRTLHIENEIQLKDIDFPALNLLEDVKILNCKSLNSIGGLERLDSLKGLRISSSAIDFETFITYKFPEKLKTLAFYTWKSKQDKLNRAVLDKMGYNEFG